MVFYFTSNVVAPPVTLFMGADKHEILGLVFTYREIVYLFWVSLTIGLMLMLFIKAVWYYKLATFVTSQFYPMMQSGFNCTVLGRVDEDLIKWGWPEDVWFHVDKVSSAHVYLRLAPGQTIDDIPNSVLDDACQLVKANSIMGNKMNDIDIVYTMWSNLKKTAGMEAGQVAFHKDKDVKKVRVAKRNNEIVNRLNKTKKEAFPDLRLERENRDRLEREDKKKLLREKKEKEKEEEKKKKDEAELRSYSTLMKPENMTTNYDHGNDSDDFM